MPKAVISEDIFDWGDDRPPNVPWSRTVIYEAHLRGLTMLRPDIRPNERGTFAALADANVIRLLAAARYHRDRAAADPRLRAGPHADRARPEELLGLQFNRLFRHRAALSVGRLAQRNAGGGAPTARSRHRGDPRRRLQPHRVKATKLGPTLSFRGLDNASYYRLVPDNRRHCINDTGTGNTLNLSHPRVLQMVMDSLRYLGDVVPRRWLPFRSRRHARPRSRMASIPAPAFSMRCGRTRSCSASS